MTGRNIGQVLIPNLLLRHGPRITIGKPDLARASRCGTLGRQSARPLCPADETGPVWGGLRYDVTRIETFEWCAIFHVGGHNTLVMLMVASPGTSMRTPREARLIVFPQIEV